MTHSRHADTRGHSALSTTQRHIEPDADAMRGAVLVR